MNKDIIPVKEGAKTKFKIHFENLTDEELGSLLYIFKLLDDEHLLKLGMAKPLGYGSVCVSAKLFLSDRKERYSKIFDGDKLYLPYEEKKMDHYISLFETYMKKNLEGNYNKDFKARIESLKIMMNKPIGYALNDKGLIEYKDVKDKQFSKLHILPTPEEMKSKV